MRLIRKFMYLSRSDRHFFIKTFCLLAVITLGLHLLQFHHLLKLLTKISQRSNQRQITATVSISKILWAINTATQYIPHAKCLARALTTQVLMTRYGHSAKLRIGVVKQQTGKLQAHAWIEHQGIVVMGNLHELSRYIPLPSLSGVKI